LTRRGGPLLAFGAGTSAVGVSPSGGGSLGGVRDDRLGPDEAGPDGGPTFGIKRRVIKPCPTVQRFVVIQ
jgi:hypothetical protein